MDIEYIENSDGSFGLFNNVYGDIYFSNIGAHKEALEKFVLPAKPEVIKKKKLKILDVCYGMGYNSKTFVDYCVQNNLNFQFDIDCVEIDKKILALGLCNFDKNINNDISILFGKELLKQLKFDKTTEEFLGENWIKDFLMKNLANFEQENEKKYIYLYKNAKILDVLHNIYYQNQYNIYISLDFHLILSDLLKFLNTATENYDLIFHDAFSIKKQPELWSQDVLSKYFELLNTGGKLLTYSNSRVLRRNLATTGFKVEVNMLPDMKQNGTIAIK